YTLDPLMGLEDPGKPLRSKLLANPKLRQRYLQYVRQIAESLEWGVLGVQVAQARNLIEESVKQDTRKLTSTQAFLEATAAKAGEANATPMLRTFADERVKYLLNHDEIKKLPTEPVVVAPSASAFRAIVPVDKLSRQESTVMISEVMASNVSGSKNSKGEFEDWIELHNKGTEAVNLEGMYLTDDMEHARKWQFPDDVTIAPGGYLLIWADGKKSIDDGLHTNFKLSKEGETLALVSEQGVVAILAFPALLDDQSYGIVGGELRVLKPSPAQQNEG
ncbi:lamin tail domain-containing protein, partial [Rhodopirellula sp.]|nr:lamin tail domain-containing protein [Rhodopirellula sp.]